MTSRLGAPVDVVPLLLSERAIFVDLLEGLAPQEWDLPTECPAWTVKGIALHVIGDDFSLLSRQRDQATDSLTLWAERLPGVEFRALLDRFNEDWVDAARFVSPNLVVELLRATGTWTHAFYAAVDPDAIGEPVPFAGPDPAPYWLISAREHLERWIHQQQVRRATGRPELVYEPHFTAAVSAIVRGFPPYLDLLDATDGTTVLLDAGGRERWSLHCRDTRWTIGDGDALDADVRLSLSAPAATTLFSRGLDRARVADEIEIEGNVTLGRQLVEGFAAVFGVS